MTRVIERKGNRAIAIASRKQEQQCFHPLSILLISFSECGEQCGREKNKDKKINRMMDSPKHPLVAIPLEQFLRTGWLRAQKSVRERRVSPGWSPQHLGRDGGVMTRRRRALVADRRRRRRRARAGVGCTLGRMRHQ